MLRDKLKELVDMISKFKSVTITDYTLLSFKTHRKFPNFCDSYHASIDITVGGDLNDLRNILDVFVCGSCKWEGEYISGSAGEMFLRFSYDYPKDYSEDDVARDFTYKQCLFKGRV